MAVADDTDNFKAEFKKYKRRDRPLDLSHVVNIRDRENASFLQNVQTMQPTVPKIPALHGLLPAQDWEVFEFLSHPGFFVIRNPFLPGYQRFWVHRCLVDLPLPPNVTNLRVHPDIDASTVWCEFVKSYSEGKGLLSDSSLRKLRWTTIGYHYDWDAKVYREDDYTPFPKDIGVLAQYVALALGFEDFSAEAGIINYYHLDSTLGGHTDHSELDHDAPLVSISFGQDAIFLLGGPTKATKPTAILLRSGDICVMSGPSRLAYHAVPRILAPKTPSLPSCFSLPEVSQIGMVVALEDSAKGDMSSVNRSNMSSSNGETVENISQTGCTAAVSEDNAIGDLLSVDTTNMSCRFGEDVETVCKQNLSKEGSASRIDVKCKHGDVRQSETVNINVHQSEQLKDSFHSRSLSQSVQTDMHSSAQNSLDEFNPSITILPSTQLSGGQYGSLGVIKVNEQIVQTMKTIDWGPLSVYLTFSRLNVNIRQVLGPGQTFPRQAVHGADSVQKALVGSSSLTDPDTPKTAGAHADSMCHHGVLE